MAEGKRQANFELLRVIAMMMVIALHYLSKGGVAVSYAQDGSLRNHIAWLADSFCIVAVNVYVLVSGYFLVGSGFRPGRLVRLVCQVLFYSLAVPLVCGLFGIVDFGGYSIYDWLPVFLPFQGEHYWFASSYLWMYLFVPVLGAAVEKLDKKALKYTIFGLLAVFSLGKSLSPFLLSTDRYGYDFGWFLCLYLIAAYIRLYGLPVLSKKGRAFGAYVGFSLLGFAVSAFSGFLARRTGVAAFSYYSDMVYCYNYLLCLAAAVALFMGFCQVRIPEGRAAELLRFLGPLTFGVYLLHENIAVRSLWPGWLGVERFRSSLAFLPHMALCVPAVFAAGILADWLRSLLFGCLEKGFIRYGKSGKKEN